MKELILTAKNRPGELHKVAEALGEAGVNIIALCAYNIGETGRIHFVVSDHAKGKRLLKKMKYKVTDGDVLVLELKHSPGQFARITRTLAQKGINIELVYGSGSNAATAKLIIAVNQLGKAKKALDLE